ncbi:hypothetical protein [Saccharopolyspora pogona]|uniref:hypothetical protein n=1 Tax=Saccharopolyspora pogona TaxID=333966 RepID=UPI001CC2488C|nr:hypothetical protein [Saccharopolyspora pogona]
MSTGDREGDEVDEQIRAAGQLPGWAFFVVCGDDLADVGLRGAFLGWFVVVLRPRCLAHALALPCRSAVFGQAHAAVRGVTVRIPGAKVLFAAGM